MYCISLHYFIFALVISIDLLTTPCQLLSLVFNHLYYKYLDKESGIIHIDLNNILITYRCKNYNWHNVLPTNEVFVQTS